MSIPEFTQFERGKSIRRYFPPKGTAGFAERAAKAGSLPGVKFVVLHFDGADPGGENRSVEECVALAC